jgi:hypothetical protein
MTNKVLLNNIDHHDLKVVARYSAECGHSVNQVLVFPTEFSDVQREYPILFQKSSGNGSYQAVAILGLDKDENLFLDKNGWDASYVPAIIARGPFSIVLQQQEKNGETYKEPKVHIDLDDSRVGATEGEPIFLPHGGNSPYLEHVSNILRRIYTGQAVNDQMFAAFEALDLLEPVSLEINLDDFKRYKITDYYTINEEQLVNLDGENLEKLSEAGFLRCAYMAASSLGNINKLINLKNRRLASA